MAKKINTEKAEVTEVKLIRNPEKATEIYIGENEVIVPVEAVDGWLASPFGWELAE